MREKGEKKERGEKGEKRCKNWLKKGKTKGEGGGEFKKTEKRKKVRNI